MKNTRKGFTLVELLVVIAILAILATVSVVGYISFINRANDSNAAAELAQIKSYIETDLMIDNTWEYELADGTKYVVVRNGNLLTATKKGVAIGVDVAINDCPDFDGLGDCSIDAEGNLVYHCANGKGTAIWEGVANACEHEETNPATCLSPETCEACGVAVDDVLGDHVERTPATCTEKAICDVCEQSYGDEPVGHVYEDGRCSCGALVVSKTHIEMAALVNITSREGSVDGLVMEFDSNISVQFDKNTSGTAPSLYDEIRLYQAGGVMTITASEDATMSKIVINCSNYTGNGNLTVEGGSATFDGKVLTITVNEDTTEVTITTGGSEKVDRLYVTNVEVYYTVKPHDCDANRASVNEVPATCTKVGSTAGAKCSKCGEILEGCTEIPVIDHNYTAVVATCTTNAKCSCGAEEENSALGHKDEDRNHICDNTGCAVRQGDCIDGDDPDTLCDYGCGKNYASLTTTKIDIFGSTGTLAGDKSKISWDLSDFTVVNYLGGTAIRTSDTDHFRAYQDSKTTITGNNGQAIAKVVITVTESKYASVCAESLETAGVTATYSGTTVTLTVDNNDTVDSIEIGATGQWRLKSIEITYQ